jgi:hypothetical protein
VRHYGPRSEQLLGDSGLRARLGSAAREKAQATYAWPVATEPTIAVYRDAIG